MFTCRIAVSRGQGIVSFSHVVRWSLILCMLSGTAAAQEEYAGDEARQGAPGDREDAEPHDASLRGR